MSGDVRLVWFRQDLRLADQPALAAGGRIAPVYVQAPEEEGDWPPGGASRWWLHHSLSALDRSLRGLGSRLILRRGPTAETLVEVARAVGARAVHYTRRYEPAAREQARRVGEALRAAGLTVVEHTSTLLFEPDSVLTAAGRPYQIFSPFWRRCLTAGPPAAPLPAPRRLEPPERWPESLPLAELGLLPAVDWAGGLRATWRAGEAAASDRLETFVAGPAAAYDEDRNRVDRDGTSGLSPHLHFGEISPRQVWATVQARLPEGAARERFLTELGWREFAHHLLWHFPHTPLEPLRPEFDRFPWRNDPAALKAWQQGRTGYPIVDAAMRQLWQVGFMPNRLRMVVASFLVKDLLLDWRLGARWFWDTLVDADLAQNTLGWQWTAGCGADAAPFYRVFNPVGQGRRWDPEGVYIRRWLPEVADRVDVHEPLEPLVDHAERRRLALEAFKELRAPA